MDSALRIDLHKRTYSSADHLNPWRLPILTLCNRQHDLWPVENVKKFQFHFASSAESVGERDISGAPARPVCIVCRSPADLAVRAQSGPGCHSGASGRIGSEARREGPEEVSAWNCARS